ncbi:CDF family Co(II)/Ni(II) efflux transporter DmeF [Metapseudomonas otitidis]|uniref:CDF family Co(II)/Ni(II) efflux transporter DmeF n=1 Tax=Metapseudomonas otitidis TaxID=319939 RepID=UPI00244940BE|nr:CDF family Co(II)/Ni(II) efflux transporter DmeF [Pseudomonas otitidis]MDG9781438.1 CDF family Co(II)/Ni(II) efflux transporter DmeF [Pseudomonas otitidis]
MAAQHPEHWQHTHHFHQGNLGAERRTRLAVWLTAVMMVAEIAGGWYFNSMALLADGWHMSSHALALGLSLLAYAVARRLAQDRRFAFGTWKIEVLGGYSSAILLLGVAGLMAVQSAERLWAPGAIHYDEAIAIAAIGLGVNLLCAWLLKDAPHDHGHPGHDHHHHDHDHDHDHGNAHAHAHQDLNLRSAYLHVIADAATSVLAIIALLAGKYWGAAWLDPVMGLVGAVLVGMWAKGLLRDSARVLLDAEMDAPLAEEVREVVAGLPVPTAITDLHLWRVGQAQYACVLGLATSGELAPDQVRAALAVHEELAHVTVEINHVLPA